MTTGNDTSVPAEPNPQPPGQDDDGAVNAEGGCDWVSLEPHPLITATQLN